MSDVTVRELEERDRTWARAEVERSWGAPIAVSRGRVHRPAELPGFVASVDEQAAGLATYHVEEGECELVTIDSFVPGRGVGTALVEAVRAAARGHGCDRLWLVTTNDNLPALRFYQRRGFVLTALHRDAIEASRRLKPQIPALGRDGIPIRDELELELPL